MESIKNSNKVIKKLKSLKKHEKFIYFTGVIVTAAIEDSEVRKVRDFVSDVLYINDIDMNSKPVLRENRQFDVTHELIGYNKELKHPEFNYIAIGR